MGPGRQLEQTLVPEGKVKLVYHHMAFLGDDSVRAAEASECAAEQGKFWELHDKLYEVQRQTPFTKDNLKQLGAAIGIPDTATYNACIDGGWATARVKADTEAGKQKGVQRTPTLFVNGRKIEGVPTWEDLQRAISGTALVPAPAVAERYLSGS
ncbi:MAG: thioredoxin domain-containing protein [Chloroflexi bacterium]|nr:thioredoxin domain-containing protein [Chloroflexota bacterium]